MIRTLHIMGLAAAALTGFGSPGWAQSFPEPLAPETASVTPLAPAAPSWVWVNDSVAGLGGGRAMLFDAAEGRMLGMLNTGMAPFALDFSKDGRHIVAIETYFSRGSRGARTDVVAVYDAATLTFSHEIEIPPKTYSGVPKKARTALLDDGRWLVTTNFTSGQSISVVDLENRRFVGETETAGCVSAYPVAERRFFMICGDGQLLDVSLDTTGKPASMERAGLLLDFARDLVFEHAVRKGAEWTFVTYRGRMIKVGLDAKGALKVGSPVALGVVPEDENQPLYETPGIKAHAIRWQVAGLQPIAASLDRNELYVLAHQGPRHSMQDPSSEVFVFDLDRGTPLRQLKLAKPATAIELTTGSAPMLAAASEAAMSLEIYDPVTGKPLRSIEGAGLTPILLQVVR
ncbi:amine dehydrogenase large subunit [Sphingopyxis sp.]|uniref:amine dehydrogenase large subunit n=1 Tax=Sphingopyxis sp. TaxID=1908224 RepID=UPI003D6CA241